MKSVYLTISQHMELGEGVVLCTVIETHGSTPRHAGSKMLVFEDGSTEGSVGGGEVENRVFTESKFALVDRKTRVVRYTMISPEAGDPGICGGTVEVLIEPILPQPVLLIIGAGHVGKAVAYLGRWLGYRVIVSDDREELCTKDMIPDADSFLICEMARIPEKISISPHTYIVIVTRGHDVDVIGLPSLLETKPPYIGLIGSKRRWIMTRKILEEKGIPAEKLDSIRSPIGLELNAESPEEIAVSIMAEVIMLRNGGTGGMLNT